MYYEDKYFKVYMGVMGLSAYLDIPIYLAGELIEKKVVPTVEHNNNVYVDKDELNNWINELKACYPCFDEQEESLNE